MLEEEGAVIVGLLVGLNVIDANLCVKGEDLDSQVTTALRDWCIDLQHKSNTQYKTVGFTWASCLTYLYLLYHLIVTGFSSLGKQKCRKNCVVLSYNEPIPASGEGGVRPGQVTISWRPLSYDKSTLNMMEFCLPVTQMTSSRFYI